MSQFLITVFSVTDYCGKAQNSGAILTIKKNSEIIPKVIPCNQNSYEGKWFLENNNENLNK